MNSDETSERLRAAQRAYDAGRIQDRTSPEYVGILHGVRLFVSDDGYEIGGLDDFHRLLAEAKSHDLPMNAIVVSAAGCNRILADVIGKCLAKKETTT
jgi:hypothetical protein